MTEDEMYDIIRGYEESERDYHERNIELEAENAKMRRLLSQALAAHELDTFFEYFEPHSFWVGWCKDVHELGIEV